MIVLLYVDDILAFAVDNADLAKLKAFVEKMYSVNHYAEVNYYLGLEMH